MKGSISSSFRDHQISGFDLPHMTFHCWLDCLNGDSSYGCVYNVIKTFCYEMYLPTLSFHNTVPKQPQRFNQCAIWLHHKVCSPFITVSQELFPTSTHVPDFWPCCPWSSCFVSCYAYSVFLLAVLPLPLSPLGSLHPALHMGDLSVLLFIFQILFSVLQHTVLSLSLPLTVRATCLPLKYIYTPLGTIF